MKKAVLDELMVAREAKRPVARLIWLDGGAEQLVYPDTLTNGTDAALRSALEACFADDRSRSVDTESGRVFVQVFNPPLRLAVVGAVHIAQALVPMALTLGYQVTVIDPRRSFATAARFPGVELDTDWPDEAMERLSPDSRTAVVTLTHDPKLDDPALSVALRSAAFYIGCLGSKRTHAGRVSRLRSAGYGEAELARLHAPIGLDLGGRSPAEIALAALAQVTATLRGGSVR